MNSAGGALVLSTQKSNCDLISPKQHDDRELPAELDNLNGASCKCFPFSFACCVQVVDWPTR